MNMASPRNVQKPLKRSPKASENPIHPGRPLGTLLHTVSLTDLDCKEENNHITGAEYYASYNLVDVIGPKIIVPGAPPVWSPPCLWGLSVPLDNGDYLRDPNGALFPNHPMDPAVEAMFSMRETNVFKDQIDILCCGSTLGNLLRYAEGIDRTFRFDVEVVGETAFCIRRENNPRQLIPDVYGYGHSFLEAFTNWEKDVSNSTSHQRIVKYQLAGLNVLVRSETDGFIQDQASKSGSKKGEAAGESNRDQQSLETLTNSLQVATTASKISESGVQESSGSTKLNISQSGRVISQSQIFDLKTRSVANPIDMDETDRRLWVNQTPNFIIAYHKRGRFDDVQTMPMLDRLRKFEKKRRMTIQRYVAALRKIIEVTKSSPELKIEVVRQGTGPLELRSQSGLPRNALSAKNTARWSSRLLK